MAADSDGPGGACGPGGGACGVVVTCEGDLRDPRFPARLRRLLRELRALLAEPHPNTLKVNKVEPWNSVRVTLSVPRAAAARLRALAAAGAPQLRALGILSVQLDGDAAVSLRLQHGAELRINTDADDASTSRSQPSSELLAGLGGIGRLLADTDGASTSAAPPPTPATPPTPAPSPQQPARDNFKSPNTVCPMDGKIPQNIPTPTTADRCEYPFGSMTQARVIHRKENTLGLGACAGGLRAPTAVGAEPQFARPSTSSFAGPPPPYPAPAPTATPPPAPAAPPAAPAAPPTVAMSSPLLVNLLQNDAAAPQPRAKPQQHPAKLDRLEDSQVELAVGRAPFEYRGGRQAAPRPSPSASPAPPAPPPAPPRTPRPPPFVRRPFPAARPAPPATPPAYRSPAHQAAPAPNATVIARPRYQPGYSADSFPAPPPPPYRQQMARPRPPLPRVTPEDFQALLPPSTTMDQKTQSSFQEFQRYQQQYNARQRAASRDASQQQDWNEPYRDSLSLLPDLPDTCDLDQLLPTLGADLNLDDTALSAISDLDTNSKLDLLSNYEQQDGTTNSSESNPDALLREITGQYSGQLNGPYTESTLTANRDVPSKSDTYEAVNESTFMPPPPVPQQSTSKTFAQTANHTIMNTHHPPFKSPPPNVSYMTASSMNSDRAVIHRLGATSSDRMAASSINTDRGPTNSGRMTPTGMSSERMGQTSMNSDSMSSTGINSDRMGSDRISTSMSSDRMSASSMNSDRLIASSMNSDRIGSMSMNSERMATTSVNTDRKGSMSMNSDRMAATSLNSDRIGGTSMNSDTMGATSMNSERLVGNTSSDRMVATSMNSDRMGSNNMSNERMVAPRLNDRTVASITSTDRMVSTSMNTERIVSSSMNSERSLASTLNHSIVANRMAGQSSSMPSSMPPPMRLPVRATTSVSTATVGSQATAQEIEEQSKQYLIKTLMRDDDIPPPKEPEKKPEELTVAQCKVKENSTDAPEMFGIAKITEIDDSKRSDEDKKNKLLKKDRDEKLVAQKGGKPRTTGSKEKPTTLKDRIVRDGKSTKVALPRPHAAKPAAPNTEAPKSPSGEKESIKLRLKLDKNEPVVQPVYKADVSFINLPKGDKSSEGELRVPPLHISLRGRNSAVIKNSKKEKKKFGPGDLHTKKIKIRKTLETDDKSHRRESDETLAPKSGDGTENSKTDEYLHVKNIKLNNHYEGDAIKTEIAGDNNVVYRMKTISKNAHIVTKSHEFKLLNNKVQTMDSLKLKKKSKLLSESGKAIEKERDKEWRNDLLEKEGKYAQNEGYREMVNNHEMKKKLPTPKLEKDGGGAKCDNLKSSDVKTVVQVDTDYNEVKTGASEDSRLLKCHKSLERTMSVDDTDTTKFDSEDNKLKRTLTESAITSPNGLIALEKKRKVSHSSCPDPPGSTNVGTIGANRVDSPPPASSQRCGAQSPRRKDRPKDKSYCKLVAERARPDPDKFGNRSPNSQAQGEDSGIESMDALSEKSPNQASQSPPGPQRKERLDMPRSTSPTSVQRIIGVIEQPPPSDELLERLSRAAGQPHYDPVPPDIDDMGDIEAELAKMHADHVNGDDAEPPRVPTPILRDDDPARRDDRKPDPPPDDRLERPAGAHGGTSGATSPKKERVDEFDLPSRMSPPLYTYSNQEKACSEAKDEKSTVAENGETKSKSEVKDEPEPKLERLPLKADFPDKSLLEQLLIEIPTPDYVGKRPESPSPSALERVARSSVRTRSSSKMNSPADGPKTPRLSPGVKLERSDSPLQPRNCLRSGSVDKTSPRTGTAAGAPAKPGPGAKRKRRESESSCASTVSCEEGPSPGRPKKKPRKIEPAKPSVAAAPAPSGGKTKKDSDSDSDEPLICKVRGKGAKGPRAPVPPSAAPVGAAGVGTRRSVRHGPAPPAPPTDTPVRRKTRSAGGEGGTPATPGTVRRRRASRDGK